MLRDPVTQGSDRVDELDHLCPTCALLRNWLGPLAAAVVVFMIRESRSVRLRLASPAEPGSGGAGLRAAGGVQARLGSIHSRLVHPHPVVLINGHRPLPRQAAPGSGGLACGPVLGLPDQPVAGLGELVASAAPHPSLGPAIR